MNSDIPIVGVILGPNTAAKKFGVKQELVQEMIAEIQYDKHPFFIRLRQLLQETTEEIGLKETAKAFNISESVLGIITKDLAKSGNEI